MAGGGDEATTSELGENGGGGDAEGVGVGGGGDARRVDGETNAGRELEMVLGGEERTAGLGLRASG